MPVVDRQQREMREQLLRAGRDREIDLVRAHELDDLLRRSLVQLEIDARIALAERADDLGQHIARLGVSRGDRQRAVELGGEVAREARDVADLAEDLARACDHLAARGRDGGEALALAREQLHAELRLELLELLADAGLARIEPLGGGRDVEPAVRDAYEILELLERHAAPRADEKAASSERVSGLGRLYNHRLDRGVNGRPGRPL